jgi:hypothetical protein
MDSREIIILKGNRYIDVNLFLLNHLEVVRPHECDDGGDSKIGEEDNQQRQVNAERNGLFGVLSLLP